MGSNMKTKILLLFTAIMALCIMPFGQASAASGLYLSPASKSATLGSSVSFAVRINADSAVNAVQANISYPADKLTYLSTSFSGTAFEIQAESSGGGGSIRMARGTLAAVTGNQLVATITFRANSSSGSGSITFNGDSSLVNNGSSVASGGTGAVISFAPAPVVVPVVVDKTPPVISALVSNEITQGAATIGWTTDEASDSVVDYGLTNAYGLAISSTERLTNHKIILASTFILPKTTYHYRVSSTDASGNKTVGEDKTFTTVGFPLTVKVLTKTKKPIAGVTVSVDGVSKKTDQSGIALFDVTPGDKTVAASKLGQSGSGNVTVVADLKTPASLDITLSHGNGISIGSIIGGGIAAFFLGAAGSALVRKYFGPMPTFKRKGKFAPRHLKMPISTVQKRYGANDPSANPYHKKWQGNPRLAHHT